MFEPNPMLVCDLAMQRQMISQRTFAHRISTLLMNIHMAFDKVEISVIVPVFQEESNIPPFLSRVLPILAANTENFEIIFAVDPGEDRTWDVLTKLHAHSPQVKGVEFSRRFGQPSATLAGLAFCTGDAAVVMDVDLQDPPELITQMVERWRSGYDVVYAQRRSRAGETWIKMFIAWLGYQLIARIAEVPIPPNTGDFRLMSRRVIREVLNLKESHGFLRGMVALVGFKQTAVLFDRAPRLHGTGHYNRFLGSIRIGLNGVICFSNYLLSITSLLGIGIALLSLLLAMTYLLMKLFGFPFPIGNPTIVILILFLGGTQLIALGVIGEYIGRIYDEVKQRPRYIVSRALGLPLDARETAT